MDPQDFLRIIAVDLDKGDNAGKIAALIGLE